VLTPEQGEEYRRDGCIVIPGFESPGEIARLRARAGEIVERFLRDGDRITMEKLDDTPWPDDSTAVPLEAKAGSLVCFHGLPPHYSAPNRSKVSWHAFTLHVTDARTEYSPRNWTQRDAGLPVRGFR
jgi:phytanoyl-CoA hydroxylase